MAPTFSSAQKGKLGSYRLINQVNLMQRRTAVVPSRSFRYWFSGVFAIAGAGAEYSQPVCSSALQTLYPEYMRFYDRDVALRKEGMGCAGGQWRSYRLPTARLKKENTA